MSLGLELSKRIERYLLSDRHLAEIQAEIDKEQAVYDKNFEEHKQLPFVNFDEILNLIAQAQMIEKKRDKLKQHKQSLDENEEELVKHLALVPGLKLKYVLQIPSSDGRQKREHYVLYISDDRTKVIKEQE